jgi:glycerophosphoryl diester phosphodiesterase
VKPHVIAHRGDSHARPENTLAAFQAAVEAGADLIEFDVQLSKDGQVVVIHDATVDRTTDGMGPVSELTLGELRGLSAGYPQRFAGAFEDERISTLAEVLSFLGQRTRLMIEIKRESITDDAADGIEARTLHEVLKAGLLDQVALLSFDPRALKRSRELAPDMLRGQIFHPSQAFTSKQMVAMGASVGASVLLPEKSLLTVELAELARAAGLRLATWVVDDPAELEALEPLGLYGIGSNRPGVLIEALAG